MRFSTRSLVAASALIVACSVQSKETVSEEILLLEESVFDDCEGIRYLQYSRNGESPLMVHILEIDTASSDVEFVVSKGVQGTDDEYNALRTSDFLRAYDLDFAINGGYFYPFRSNRLDKDGVIHKGYPNDGDGVQIRGLSIANGITYSETERNYRVDGSLVVRDNQVSITYVGEEGDPDFALSAGPMLVFDGQIEEHAYDEEYKRFFAGEHPRSAVALKEEGRVVALIAVDGRQNASAGISIEEFALFLHELGYDFALNLDGGGSTTLVGRKFENEVHFLNRPINGGVLWRERAVANHFGVRMISSSD